MCRYNGPAEGESQAHPASLGGEKRMEQARQARLVYAKATVLHCHRNASRGYRCSAHHQRATPVLHLLHGLEGVAHQVQEHLPQLNAVPGYRGEVASEVQRDPHVLRLGIAAHQSDGLVDDVIDIETGLFQGALVPFDAGRYVF
jgi:hypothetical protein